MTVKKSKTKNPKPRALAKVEQNKSLPLIPMTRRVLFTQAQTEATEPPEFKKGPIQPRAACDRSALSSDDYATALELGLSCQLSGDIEHVTLPARVLNAHKGDIILVPGGIDVISQLLHQVDTPQRYAHSVLVTQDFEEIVHSTASEDRMLQERNINISPFAIKENALRYMWPGAVRQTVAAAVTGEVFPDPESKQDFTITGMRSHALGVFVPGQPKPVLVEPLVIKPDPQLETKALRQKLHQVADRAISMAARPGETSKTHYRLFGYSQVSATLAPQDAGWAVGTFPSVCASFIWKVVTDIGLKTSPPDGLADYNPSERTRAATWLHGFIKHQVIEKYGLIAKIVDADERAANQIVNAFANDDVNGTTSTAWHQPGTGHAISPDNLLAWVGPDHGGVYGHSEPLEFQPRVAIQRKASHWQPFVGTDSIKGRVFRTVGENRVPVPGAQVRVFEGCMTYTNELGAFELLDVPRGRYLLGARALIEQELWKTTLEIDLNSDSHHNELLVLQPPRNPDHRRLDVHVGFSPTNVRSPSYPGMLEERTSHVYLLAAEVSKDWNPEAFKWGGDLRVNVATKFTKKRLNTIPVSYAVDVVATGKLFQDSPTGSSVLLAHQAISFTLGIEEIQTQAMKLEVFAVSVSIIVTVKNSHATIAMLQDDW